MTDVAPDREPAVDWPVEHGFRMRGLQMTRVETFTDAAFAFAVTLLVGIATTLFTAIFVSRTFMDFAVRKSSARLVF